MIDFYSSEDIPSLPQRAKPPVAPASETACYAQAVNDSIGAVAPVAPVDIVSPDQEIPSAKLIERSVNQHWNVPAQTKARAVNRLDEVLEALGPDEGQSVEERREHVRKSKHIRSTVAVTRTLGILDRSDIQRERLQSEPPAGETQRPMIVQQIFGTVNQLATAPADFVPGLKSEAFKE
jgi:hypothetical protein